MVAVSSIFKEKLILVFLFLAAISFSVQAQPADENPAWKIPEKMKKAAIQALAHFPELRNTQIQLIERKQSSPLQTAPRILDIIKPPSRRCYVVSISTNSSLDSVRFQNLSYSSQVGVLGHEFSHISDMKDFRFRDFIRHAFRYTFSRKYSNAFEYNTDLICIQHGLGPELLSWSREVRKKLGTKQYFQQKSSDDMPERYMNPDSILREMDKLPSNLPQFPDL